MIDVCSNRRLEWSKTYRQLSDHAIVDKTEKESCENFANFSREKRYGVFEDYSHLTSNELQSELQATIIVDPYFQSG